MIKDSISKANVCKEPDETRRLSPMSLRYTCNKGACNGKSSFISLMNMNDDIVSTRQEWQHESKSLFLCVKICTSNINAAQNACLCKVQHLVM